MNKGLTKKFAYVTTVLCIMIIIVLITIVDSKSLVQIAPTAITVLAGLSGISQGINVANNYQKAKHYNPEMDKLYS